MMISPETLLDAYIDANILLVVAFSLWLCVRVVLKAAGQVNAFSTQLRLLNAGFLAVLLSPFFVLGAQFAAGSGLSEAQYSVNLADFFVAQYLNGSIEMKASEFAHLLSLRTDLVRDVVTLSTGPGIAIVSLAIAGFVWSALRILRSIYRLRLLIQGAFLWRSFGKIDLLFSDDISVPFSTRGLRRRYVVLPTMMLGRSDDLRIVLAHEFQHMRQFDIEWEFLLETLRPFFFWNPAFIFWKWQVEQLRELSCDQNVLSRGVIAVRAYCECLLRVCEEGLSPSVHRIALARVAFVQVDPVLFRGSSVGFLRRRIASLFLARSGRARFWNAMIMPFVGVVALASVAIQTPSDWSQDRLMLSSIVNLERLEARQQRAE